MTLSRSLACVALFSYPVSSIEEVGDDSWTDAACATGAVEVVGAIHREVKVDHVVDHRGIEATRCDVSAHKHRVLLGKELLPELLSLLLRDHEPVSERVCRNRRSSCLCSYYWRNATMQARSLDIVLGEEVIGRATTRDGLAEDDRSLTLSDGLVEQLEQQLLLVLAEGAFDVHELVRHRMRAIGLWCRELLQLLYTRTQSLVHDRLITVDCHVHQTRS